MEGIKPCPVCDGTGLKGGLAGEFHPRDIRRSRLVLIPAACTACRGCSHATHGECSPLHAGDDTIRSAPAPR
ncbi:hypothetical protein C8259_16390 [Nocardia nova]|uniref:Uncharacterized protein n=1 Tax=Nocardia nova TaxID=37330 RepID=A0A2T2Z419_9NOCA|nr:hypothetical protein C8259_16390 [Nocardia nova]